jgi:hypothetical protein
MAPSPTPDRRTSTGRQNEEAPVGGHGASSVPLRGNLVMGEGEAHHCGSDMTLLPKINTPEKLRIKKSKNEEAPHGGERGVLRFLWGEQ